MCNNTNNSQITISVLFGNFRYPWHIHVTNSTCSDWSKHNSCTRAVLLVSVFVTYMMQQRWRRRSSGPFSYSKEFSVLYSFLWVVILHRLRSYGVVLSQPYYFSLSLAFAGFTSEPEELDCVERRKPFCLFSLATIPSHRWSSCHVRL